MLVKFYIQLFFTLSFLLSGSMAMATTPVACLCVDGSIPVCKGFVCLNGKYPTCLDSMGSRYTPPCTVMSTSGGVVGYPSSCLCIDGSIPACGSMENFICYMNKFPLCQDHKHNSYIPPCTSTSGAPVPDHKNDGCCKACPDGSTPSCPSELTYWCVKGEPNCCKPSFSDPINKKGLISLACTPINDIKDKLPSCFYPSSAQSTEKETLCNSSTVACPDGSPIVCDSGFSFMCIKGVPDCCKGDVCTDKADPACFYTKACSSSQSSNLNACCATCGDRTTTIMCEEPLQYWCVNGKKDCCTLPAGGVAPDDLLCSTEDEADQCSTEDVERSEKCNSISLNDKCCSFCPNGSLPKCLVGKSLWCKSDAIKCCEDDGENCENVICESIFQCPSNILDAKRSGQISGGGCCKTCQNQVDSPVCPSGTSSWCVDNKTRCCSNSTGKLLCLSVAPKCPDRVTRQCN